MASIANVTCPFCSLLCDDLTVRNKQQQLDVSANDCRLAGQGFAAPLPPAQARLKGVPTTIDQAVTAASRILQQSGKPLIAGLGTDVDGIRAALRLAEKVDAALLQAHKHHAGHNLKALQTRGGMMTTLAEVKNRADTIIFIGNNVTGDYPRFIERFINTPYSLFVGQICPEQIWTPEGRPKGARPGWRTSKNRKLAYLGRPGTQELNEFNDHAPVVVSGHGDEIADNLALLRTKLADEQLSDYQTIPAAKNRKLNQVAGIIRDADYGVLVWCPAALPQDHADLIISSILDLARDLNTRQRFAGLSLSGSNGAASFQSVATWQTGFPTDVNFRSGCPSGIDTDLSAVDSLLWISTFTDDTPPALDVPTIILSPYRTGATDADVYIPVGIPGIDHTGSLFRTDNIINMPLKQVRDSGSRSAAWVIREIISCIEGNLT